MTRFKIIFADTLMSLQVPHAISEAACVRVGNALGAGDPSRAIVSTRVSLLLAGIILLLLLVFISSSSSSSSSSN